MSASIVIIVLLLGWSLYRRVSRTVRFVPLRSRRFLVRTVLWTVLLILPLLESRVMPAGSYLWYAGGLVLGIVLGLIAMRTVRYENRGGIWHYRMNLWIGAIVTLLFVGRVLVDFSGDQALISSSAAGAAPVQPNIASDGSSLGLYALVFSYYAYTGVVLYLKARSLARESQVSGEV